MKILALIPARMGSSRFPGKPMARILGKPMIGHVFDNISTSSILTDIAVATCDTVIKDYIESIGGRVILTSDRHERASDRCAEALSYIEAENDIRYDTVVMVQGDEPMIKSAMIEEALTPLFDSSDIKVTNLLGRINDKTEFEDRNCIKVVCDLAGNALYFSREPIPTRYRSAEISIGKQVCVIPFRRDFLVQYTNMTPTPLEIAESIDMLRILEHGMKIRMVSTKHDTYPVDTIEDLRKVERLIGAEFNRGNAEIRFEKNAN